MPHLLPAILTELTTVLGEGIEIHPMEGGAINHSFKLILAEEFYFLKVFDDATAGHLDRQALFSQQLELAKRDIAPAPLYLSNKHDFQVDQWVAEPTLAESALSKTAKCLRLAKVLNVIHHLDMALPSLDLARDWHSYLALSPCKMSVVQQPELASMLTYWQQQSQQLSVTCHNDLAFSHVTDAKKPLVFDWEYGAKSNPYFDLASCLTINQLNHLEQRTLLNEYAQLTGVDIAVVESKVHKMLPIVAKTYELWHQAFA